MVYEGIFGSIHELNYRRLNDNGWSEPERITIDTLDLAHFNLTLVDEDQPLVVWDQLVPSNDTLMIKIFWNRKIFENWSIPNQLSNLHDSFDPTLITDKNNTTHTVWSRRIYGISPTYNDSLFYCFFNSNIWADEEKIPFNLSPPLYGPSQKLLEIKYTYFL